MDRHEWAAATLAVGPGDRVLEIGSGHGLTAAAVCARLAAAGGDGRLLGLDRSATMTAAARRRNAAHLEAGRAEFRTVSWPGADLGGERFDRAYAFNVRLLWNDEAAVRAVGRALRPDGLLCLFHRMPDWSPEAYRELAGRAVPVLEAAGLTVLDKQLEEASAVRSGCLLAKRTE